jgi:anthranilate phosphoribosyltransferase
VWTPEIFGVPRASRDALAGGGAADNARIVEAVLRGEPGPRRDIVLVNAAAGLMLAGLAADLRGGMTSAMESIDSGCAAAVLGKLQKKFPAK